MRNGTVRRLMHAAGIAAMAMWVSTTPALAHHEPALEHIDEAEDVVESLLSWRHVLTRTVTDPDNENPSVPEAPMNTLINVDRADIEKLSSLLTAAAKMTPQPTAEAKGPRGDLRAHLDQAMEIVRELQAPEGRPVGTSGGGSNLVTIDRVALERLELELDAMEEVSSHR